ncbi:MAG TPA: hypothetical protein VNZ68_09815 [Rhodocyclaceae bacterium]|nr:hypothetical protein [Rhodocyclaceae bacterium]
MAMKNILALVATLLLSSSLLGAPHPAKVADEQLAKKIEYLEENIKETRRDQLNYKIEKDLLKEAYTSSLTTLNLVITFGLAIAAFFGYQGLKDINKVKSDYQEELGQIRQLRQEIEISQREITEAQNKSAAELERLSEYNKTQDRRIQILEVQEKALNLLKTGNPIRALEYCAAGLDIEPDNILLLDIKRSALGKLHRYNDAKEIAEKICELDPSNIPAITNLLEYMLITNDIARYDALIDAKGAAVKTLNEGLNAAYLIALRHYVANEFAQVKQAVLEAITPLDETMSARLENWSFQELEWLLGHQSESNGKKILESFVGFLKGQKNKTTLALELDAIPTP